MSKIGLTPITILEGVTLSIEDSKVTVKGPKGELKTELPRELKGSLENNVLHIERLNDEKPVRSLHGTYRALIANFVEGVKNGFVKNLELVGVGYRARMEGTALVMDLGLNHPVRFDAPEGITIEVPEETKIAISGIDKQKVGEFAAKVRETRKPEPYKGKGIRYEGEYVRRKSAKASVTAG